MKSQPSSTRLWALVVLGVVLAVALFAMFGDNSRAHTELDEPSGLQELEPVSLAGPSTGEEGGDSGQEAERGRVANRTPIESTSKGTIVLMSLGRFAEMAGTAWRFSPIGGVSKEALDKQASDAGTMALPPGHWRLEALDAKWVIEEPIFELREDQRLRIWVRRQQELRVRVESIRGLAIANAEVRWAMLPLEGRDRSAGYATDRLQWSIVRRTDSKGIARFAEVVGPGLKLGVQAEGYASQSIVLAHVTEETTVSLVPARSTIRHFTLVDAKTLVPVRSASAYDHTGILTCSEDSKGTYRIHLTEGDSGGGPLSLLAPGYCSVSVGRASLSLIQDPVGDPIRLFRACRVMFTSKDNKQRMTVWPRIEELADKGRAPPIPSSLDLQAGRTEEILVPQDAVVSFSAINRQGESCQGRLVATGESIRVPIRCETEEDLLIIHLQNGMGQPVLNGEARANYWDDQMRRRTVCLIRALKNGDLLVPRIGPVRWIDLRAPGHGEVRLKDYLTSSAKEKSGAVRVTLHKSHPVQFTLRNAQGSPSSGIVINVSMSKRTIAPTEYTKGAGGLPTDHPKWSLCARLRQRIVSDGTGSGRVDLPKGSYTVSFVAQSRFVGGTSGYWGGLRAIYVAGKEEFEFTVPSLIYLTVVGFDAETGFPLETMRINGDSQNGGSLGLKRGHRRELWMPDSCREIWVGSRGYAGQHYRIAASKSQSHFEIRARLWPCQAGVLQIVDVPDALRGQAVWIRVSRIIANVKVWGGHGYLLKLDASGRSPLVVSVGPTAKIEIRVQKINGQRWIFKPIQDIWAPGKTVAFRAALRAK